MKTGLCLTGLILLMWRAVRCIKRPRIAPQVTYAGAEASVAASIVTFGGQARPL